MAARSQSAAADRRGLEHHEQQLLQRRWSADETSKCQLVKLQNQYAKPRPAPPLGLTAPQLRPHPHQARAAAAKDTASAPVIDVTQHGIFKVLGKGQLPAQPVVVKAKFFSKLVGVDIDGCAFGGGGVGAGFWGR